MENNNISLNELKRKEEEEVINISHLYKEIEELEKNEEVKENFTFRAIITALKNLINEYLEIKKDIQTNMALIDDLHDELAIANVISSISRLQTEKRKIINEIVEHLIKIQKLSNDKLKINLQYNQEEEIPDIEPTEF